MTTRLERALSAFLSWQEARPREPAEALLRRHADLEEYLRPMLEEEARPAPDAERVLGDYRLVRELGRGGMGVVFEAVQVGLGRRVALKVLAPHLTNSPATLARFRREAMTAGRLQHPGIVQVVEFGTDGDTHFIAMELVPGMPLDRVVKELAGRSLESIRGRDVLQAIAGDAATASGSDSDTGSTGSTWTWDKGYVETVVGIAAQVADSLEFAHQRGVIHRDVKPSNVLMRRDGRAVLTDFGLAREEGLPSLTMTGEFAGSPYYVSPEQAMARRELDRRSDVFSLGTTLFELLTHRRPFGGRNRAEIAGSIMLREPPDPQKLNPALAPDLAAIVLKALEKAPGRRYQTAAEMAADLRAFLEYRPVVARRPTAAARVRRWLRREPLKASLGAVLAVVLVLGGYVLTSQAATAAGRETLHEQRVQALLHRGYIEYLQKGPEKARQTLDEVLDLDPGNPYAIVGITRGFPGSEREKVLPFLDAHQVEGRSPAALARIRAAALRGLGRTDEAEAIEAELGEPRDALELFVAGILRLPGPGRPPPSEAECKEILGLFESAVYRSPSANLLNFLQLAYVASRAGDAEAAAQCAEALMILWPESDAAWLAAGVALTFDRTERAIAAFREAIRINPDSQLAYRNLALALSTAGDLEAAIEADRKAIELDPEDSSAHSILSMHLTRKGEFEAALEPARRAVELAPSSPSFRNMLGAILERTGDLEGAVAEVRKAIELAPRYGRAHRGLLGLSRRLGDLQGQLDEHRRWQSLFPEDPSAHHALAAFVVEHEADLGQAARKAGLVAAQRAVDLSGGKDEAMLETLERARELGR